MGESLYWSRVSGWTQTWTKRGLIDAIQIISLNSGGELRKECEGRNFEKI
jgi:hypothetical protein